MAVSLLPLPQQPEGRVLDGPKFSISWIAWFRAIRDLLTYVKVGTGDPTGVVVADAGTVYHRLDGAGPNFYVKEGAANNGTSAGWASK